MEIAGSRAIDSQADPRQTALAQADLAAWLTPWTELGSLPDETELLRTVALDVADGPCDLFVFRFRVFQPHWAADRGWMIGIAGPYLRSLQPTAVGLGFTFSAFAAEDSMTVDEHVTQLLGALDAWRARAKLPDHGPNKAGLDGP